MQCLVADACDQLVAPSVKEEVHPSLTNIEIKDDILFSLHEYCKVYPG